jgi:hypothetical protein
MKTYTETISYIASQFFKDYLGGGMLNPDGIKMAAFIFNKSTEEIQSDAYTEFEEMRDEFYASEEL